jgi:hypothetical protein
MMPSPPVSPSRRGAPSPSSPASSVHDPSGANSPGPDRDPQARTSAHRARAQQTLPTRRIRLDEGVEPTEQGTTLDFQQYRERDPLLRRLTDTRRSFAALPDRVTIDTGQPPGPALAQAGAQGVALEPQGVAQPQGVWAHEVLQANFPQIEPDRAATASRLVSTHPRGTAQRLQAIDERVRGMAAHLSPDIQAFHLGGRAAQAAATDTARRLSGNGTRLLSQQQQRDCIGVAVYRGIAAAVSAGAAQLLPQVTSALAQTHGLTHGRPDQAARYAADALPAAAAAACRAVRRQAMDAAFGHVVPRDQASSSAAQMAAVAATDAALAATLDAASRDAVARAVHNAFDKVLSEDAIAPVIDDSIVPHPPDPDERG